MKSLTIREPFSGGDTFRFYPLSDLHIEAADSNEDVLKAVIARIKADPMARWGMGGDAGDLIRTYDKRFRPGMWKKRYVEAWHDPESHLDTEFVDHLEELFAPILGKMWYWMDGNHETGDGRARQSNLSGQVLDRLKIGSRYLGYSGAVVVQFARKEPKSGKDRGTGRTGGGSVPMVIDLHHGWQGGRRPGAQLNQLQVELARSNADIILRGHSHQRHAEIFAGHKYSPKAIRQWPRVGAITGTFKRGHLDKHTTWEEERGFDPKIDALLGPPIIDITPGTGGGGNTLPMIDYSVSQGTSWR